MQFLKYFQGVINYLSSECSKSASSVTFQHLDKITNDVLQNYTPEIYIILLTNVISITSTNIYLDKL